MITEQRKMILDDNEKKKPEEIQAWLEGAGFNLKRSYQTLRGTASTMFIQDIDEGLPAPAGPHRCDMQDLEKQKRRVQESFTGAHFSAIMELLKVKMETQQNLTPIELIMARMFAKGVDEIDKVRARGLCEYCNEPRNDFRGEAPFQSNDLPGLP